MTVAIFLCNSFRYGFGSYVRGVVMCVRCSNRGACLKAVIRRARRILMQTTKTPKQKMHFQNVNMWRCDFWYKCGTLQPDMGCRKGLGFDDFRAAWNRLLWWCAVCRVRVCLAVPNGDAKLQRKVDSFSVCNKSSGP